MSAGRPNHRELTDGEFTEIYRVKPPEFQGMLLVLQEALTQNPVFAEKLKVRDITPENMLLLTVERLLDNDNIRALSRKYDISYGYAYPVTNWVISTLGKKGLSAKLPYSTQRKYRPKIFNKRAVTAASKKWVSD